ncbi:hypothetical protein BVRB_7g162660 [Beta vulgaris subsp. vulgaris]|nr:hypothetical protein BVRB_7g162660 [Beta vulgaris subsp. vulgaris]
MDSTLSMTNSGSLGRQESLWDLTLSFLSNESTDWAEYWRNFWSENEVDAYLQRHN